MRVALYARYSSDRQNERSIEDQLAVCRRHAEARGWTVAITFSDAAISGAAMANRPGLQRLLATAPGGEFQLVLVEDEDRLARNLEHQANIYNRLKHAGVGIATLASDGIGILEVGLRGVMAELYLVGLSQKTRRGMRANAEAGRATGSRLYGYSSQPGGAIAVATAEAAVIRRILTDFADGATGRDIAAALNAEHVPGPRGGPWNASTINGSRQRGNGVLHTELYTGVKTWNRMEVRKDPSTGKRLPVMRDPAQWRRTPVPELRIVDQALWDRVQARLAMLRASAPQALANARRASLFGGLMRCGVCGASYTATGGGRLICAGHRERGPAVCANRRTLSRAAIEARVLDGLRERLLSPQAVSAYVRAYHAAWADAARAKADLRAPLTRRLAELLRSIDRVVDAVCAGGATPRMLERMRAQEAERTQVESDLAAMDEAAARPSAPPITLHPSAAASYAALVDQLQAQLAQSAGAADTPSRDLVAAVRALVLKIEIIPTSDAAGAPVDITLHGDLARFLAPPGASAAPQRWGGQLVAGGGIVLAPAPVPVLIRLGAR